jgi:putative lipoic acid-binding regulatory protein
MYKLPAADLLEATHHFPGPYIFKAIGHLSDEFVARTVAMMRTALGVEVDPPFSFRQTANGRYVAVTFQPQVANAQQVLEVYRLMQKLEGLIFLW